MTNGWIKTQFSFFSLVSRADCGCHYSDEDEGRLVCDQLCQTPLCQVHVWSLFVPQIYQWHHLHAENGKWFSGAAHFEIIMQRFTHGCRPEQEFVYFLIWLIFFLVFLFFVPLTFSPLCHFSLYSSLTILFFSSKPLTTCFWWLCSFTNCLLGLCQSLRGEQSTCKGVGKFCRVTAFWLC